MSNYTVRKSQNHDMVLEKDGMECFCPFQAPILMPVPTSVGGMGMSIVRMPCGTLCPHARLIPKNDSNESVYEMSCNGSVVSIDVTENEPPQEDKKSPLIKI